MYNLKLLSTERHNYALYNNNQPEYSLLLWKQAQRRNDGAKGFFLVACVASVSLGLGSKERPRNGILPARIWGERRFRYRQHCKPRSVPNVSSFCWAFPLLTSRENAHKTFQFTSCQLPNESILHKGHKGLAWVLNAFIGGLSESYDSPLKLPSKCLKKRLNWDLSIRESVLAAENGFPVRCTTNTRNDYATSQLESDLGHETTSPKYH